MDAVGYNNKPCWTIDLLSTTPEFGYCRGVYHPQTQAVTSSSKVSGNVSKKTTNKDRPREKSCPVPSRLCRRVGFLPGTLIILSNWLVPFGLSLFACSVAVIYSDLTYRAGFLAPSGLYFPDWGDIYAWGHEVMSIEVELCMHVDLNRFVLACYNKTYKRAGP